jgi:hypothetical protein
MVMRSTKFLGAARAAQGRAPNWRKLIHPRLQKSDAAKLASTDKLFREWEDTAMRVPSEVPTIDWAEWKKAIKTPGVVEELQKEYEANKVEDVSYDHLKPVFAKNEAAIAELKQLLPFLKNELQECDKHHKQLEHNKTASDNWTMDDWYKYYPGLEDYHREQGKVDLVLPTLDEKANREAGGLKELIAIMKTGEYIDTQIVTDELTKSRTTMGDYDFVEEDKLMAKGEWSIERLHKSKEERASIHEKSLKLLGGGIPASLKEMFHHAVYNRDVPYEPTKALNE